MRSAELRSDGKGWEMRKKFACMQDVLRPVHEGRTGAGRSLSSNLCQMSGYKLDGVGLRILRSIDGKDLRLRWYMSDSAASPSWASDSASQ